MAKYKITKQIDFGPWTIGDKNYGPSCPSCMVPINNYAPKVGDIVEGNIEERTYYAYENNHKVLKKGNGILYDIKTNGPASTQAQSSVQFISEDHLQEYVEPSNPTNEDPTNTNPTQNPNSSENETNHVGEAVCWLCENKWVAIILIAVIIIIVVSTTE